MNWVGWGVFALGAAGLYYWYKKHGKSKHAH
jgi:hypothetical protein